MNESICRFLPAKNEETSIKTVRFVYETECAKLSQPFVHPIYVLHIVTCGTAVLQIDSREYSLKRGDIFFAFPAYPYYLFPSKDFEYIYISFMGSGVASVLTKCKVSPSAPYYNDYGFLCDMFENAIRRITLQNANILTESVLYYALSFLFGSNENDETESKRFLGGVFETIVDYVDHHYRENDLSLGRLANVFSYSEKYLSSLFKKHIQMGFINYLNNLRIQYANELIEKGEMTIGEIAQSCGYRDYSYFSRVFKKSTGKTPTECLKYMKIKKPCKLQNRFSV